MSASAFFALILGLPAPVAVVAGAVVSVVVVALGWHWTARDRDYLDDRDERTRSLAIPYYVEPASLRSLASQFGVQVPLRREVTVGRQWTWRTLARTRSETREMAAEIDLPLLVDAIRSTFPDDEVSFDVAALPLVEDRRVLGDAIRQVERGLGDTSRTRELLSQVEEAYGVERAEAIIKLKREELAEITERQQLIILRGEFCAFFATGEEPREIHLTAFDSVGANGFLAVDSTETVSTPVPDGIGIHVALPDAASILPAGQERLRRPGSFYGQVVAHSPSYDAGAGILTCAAYAVWASNKPRRTRRAFVMS